MAAATTREQARQRAWAAFEAELDRVIPAEADKPLKGRTMLEFEDQAERVSNTIYGVLVEQRCALEHGAVIEPGQPGPCPYCCSARTRLLDKPRQQEFISPRGEVVIALQSVRCRSCGRSFSPSTA